jgi:hypothetical protein
MTSKTTYNEFGSPEVRVSTIQGHSTGQINVPATGSVEYNSDELREMANHIENNKQSPLVSLVVGEGDVRGFVVGLREAADILDK